MKNIILILLFPFISLGQNKIDPIPVISDTTLNYNIIDPIQHNFFLGWNWGTPGKKLDDALYMNMYHGYPTALQNNNDDYADNIHIVQALEGNVISGRPSTATFNSQSLYLEPTIKVIHPDGPIEFQPTLRNQNGAVFGFMKKSNEIRYKNDPLNPDFGRVFLYKDSMTSLPKVVMDSIWSRNILRFYNYVNDDIINRTKLNGKELFVSINLKALEPITPFNKDDVVLTIKLKYKVWNDDANGINKGGYVDSNYVKFRNFSSKIDTTHIYDSRGNWRGIRKDTTDSLNFSPGIREFQITAAMLASDGNGTADSNITLSAYTFFRDEKAGLGDYKWNPLLKPDWHDHGIYKEYINDLDLEVTYHGNLNVAIDWIRLETPRAREIYDGKYDIDIYTQATAMMDEIEDETIHNPKLFKFYVSDELLPHQWGINRYLNLLLDTLGASETTLVDNPAGHFMHSTAFKEYWTGTNLRFLNEQATPAIEYSLTRDSIPEKLKKNVNSGETIKNNATIVFDENPAITTNTWTNIIDTIAPVTNSLTANYVATKNAIELRTNAADNKDGSGVGELLYYVSIDGTPFKLIGSGFDTEISFDANIDMGKMYRFYAVATDNVGNQEYLVPKIAEVDITAPTSVDYNSFGADVNVYPNPVSNVLSIEFVSENASPVAYQLTDMSGKVMIAGNFESSYGMSNYNLNISDLTAGVYILRLNQDRKQGIYKIIKQ